MSLKERVYSMLLVSSTTALAATFTKLLSESRYYPIHTASSISSAKRMLAEKTYDFIIVNAPLPDDFGTQFAIDTCIATQSAVLFLVKNEIYDSIHDKTVKYGVFTLPKPIAKSTILQALNWMESARERLRQSEKKSISIEEKMTEIRLVNKAKWFLIQELQMNESEAHHYIEKQAMNRCVSKKIIAEEIIRTYA